MDVNTFRQAKEYIEKLEHWETQQSLVISLRATSHALVLDEEFNGSGNHATLPPESKKVILDLIVEQLDKKITNLKKQLESL